MTPHPDPLPKGEGASGFTLAEVLITLGIIGVVAAMTLPTLIQNYKVKQTVTALKTNYSIFENAFKMAVAEKGEVNYWGISPLIPNPTVEGSSIPDYVNDDNINSSKILYDSIKPYLNIIKSCEPGDESCIKIQEGAAGTSIFKLYSGILANGSSFYMFARTPDCTNFGDNVCADLTVDINGPERGENEWGKDIFRFSIMSSKIKPRGLATETWYTFDSFCQLNMPATSRYREGCTAWVIYNENMDYLHCDDLSWNGKTKCK